MSKSGKNDPIDKLRNVSGNYKWAELVKLLSQLGYKKLEREGSRVAFFNSEKNCLLHIHKPHPKNTLGKATQRDVIKHLIENGIINE